MRKIYLQFTEDYSGLSPYEVHNFCEVLLCKVEKQSVGYPKKARPLLSERELLPALTDTMRDIALMLREQEMEEQKAYMFTTKKIAA